MDLPPAYALLRRVQSGVVSRRQLLASGLTPNDIRRLIRRRELAQVHPGVYVDHTGVPTWFQRAWAAVLWAEPAILFGASARRAVDSRGRLAADDGLPVHVAIAHRRTLQARDGIVIHRVRDLARQTRLSSQPPSQRTEHATIALAIAAADRLDAVAHIADVVGARITTTALLSAALAERSRVPDRAFLTAVLADVGAGTCSVLEHGYLTLVERPHRLPTAERQFRDSTKGTLYRDAVYLGLNTIIELDGRLHHSRVHDRDRDLERDLDAAISGAVTARLGWGQVYGRPCRTAAKVGALLAANGWRASPQRCARCSLSGA
ncbi:type IV toxin-antitoxin system AbiEi family antitoxin domain-containing protein [Nocardioides montaniterrae]